jgi:HEAT repeat protein
VVKSDDLRGDPSKRSTAELLAAARVEIPEGDAVGPVPYLVALQERPTEDVFGAAVRLLSHDERDARELGARILRELGPYDRNGRRPFTARAVPLLVERLGRESDPRVLGWVISALGYNGAREALGTVLPFAAHPHWRVRFHVAAALPSLVSPRGIEPAALTALRGLCHDHDADTRFYALYALVEEVTGVDAEALCETIADFLDDPDEQVRALARRQHQALC